LALIDLFDIKKQYDIKLLLNDVNFHLNAGERIAVVGQNGCGKSTLMKIALNKGDRLDYFNVVTYLR